MARVAFKREKILKIFGIKVSSTVETYSEHSISEDDSNDELFIELQSRYIRNE